MFNEIKTIFKSTKMLIFARTDLRNKYYKMQIFEPYTSPQQKNLIIQILQKKKHSNKVCFPY